MFEQIISLENIFAAWKEFRRGKASKHDVQEFEWNLEDHVFSLHEDLKNGTYAHGPYESFYVCDPKRRHIHKPPVRDRLLHHAIHRVIEPLFDRRFIFDAWSCRKEKGTHHAVERFQKLAWKLARNNTKVVWVLKLDIQKFFDNVDQEILLSTLSRTIEDEQVMELLRVIVTSFTRGIPLGNLTSQLFANVYLHELDRWARGFGIAYLRYCDDFVFLSRDRAMLVQTIPAVQTFLSDRLRLSLHPKKILLTPYHSGVDFLGWVCFPHHRVLRTKTGRRMVKRINDRNRNSYLGLLRHGRTQGWQSLIIPATLFTYVGQHQGHGRCASRDAIRKARGQGGEL